MLQKLSENNLPIGIGPSEHPGDPGGAWGPVVAVVAVAYLAWLLLTPSKAARRAETT